MHPRAALFAAHELKTRKEDELKVAPADKE
jgi:hypothetical protein